MILFSNFHAYLIYQKVFLPVFLVFLKEKNKILGNTNCPESFVDNLPQKYKDLAQISIYLTLVKVLTDCLTLLL